MSSAPPPSSSSTPLPYRAPAPAAPPPLVAVVGWLVPGAGYWLVGQWARGLVVGVTIVFLFVAGLLVGGVRAVEAPPIDPSSRFPISVRGLAQQPWFLAQILTGPLGVGAAVASNWASKPADGADAYGPPRGEVSHGRLNEIAVLYTAVAGLLNLMAMIDAAHRAGEREPVAATAPAAPAVGGEPSHRPEAS
jgi:hypothetical protein